MLRQALAEDTHSQSHQEALDVIAEIGTEADIQYIVPFLDDSNGRTRTLAGLALTDPGNERGHATVFMQAESDFPGVRLQAVKRLPNINTGEARQHLKRLADDDDDRVREAARAARH